MYYKIISVRVRQTVQLCIRAPRVYNTITLIRDLPLYSRIYVCIYIYIYKDGVRMIYRDVRGFYIPRPPPVLRFVILWCRIYRHRPRTTSLGGIPYTSSVRYDGCMYGAFGELVWGRGWRGSAADMEETTTTTATTLYGADDEDASLQ